MHGGSADLQAHDPMLFSDFVSCSYLPYVQKSKRSWKIELCYLNRHILPYLGSFLLSEISAGVLQQWESTVEKAGLSRNSCFRMFRLVTFIMNCAVRWGFLPGDEAFKDAVFCSAPQRKPSLLSAEEEGRLLRIIRNFRNRSAADVIHFILLTGTMRSEALYARWEDVDVEKRTLRTTKSYTGRPRYIPLNGEAMKLLQSLPKKEGVPWIFTTSKGTRLQSVTREWGRIREKLGRPELRLLDLRHTFAERLIAAGADEKTLRQVFGYCRKPALSKAAQKGEHGNGK